MQFSRESPVVPRARRLLGGPERIELSDVADEPRGNAGGGGEVAAPVFSRVVARALRVLGIAPDSGETV